MWAALAVILLVVVYIGVSARKDSGSIVVGILAGIGAAFVGYLVYTGLILVIYF